MSSRVFDGTFYTTTGLSGLEKEKISNILDPLGANYVSSLNTKVTVLIVGSMTTEKMKYCLEKRKDVTFFHHSNINKLFDLIKSSTSDENNNNNNIIKIDRTLFDCYFPWLIFEGKSFCLVRLSETDSPFYEKIYITNLIKHFGGEVTSSLSERTDYLITILTNGTRFHTALDWGKPVLHPKWVIDCCNCSRILDFESYDISKYDNPSLIENLNFQSFTRLVGIDYGKTRNNYLFPKTNLRTVKSKNDLFKGFVFSYLDFNDGQISKLLKVIKQYGGEISIDNEKDSKNISFILVPSDKPRRIINDDGKIVNEWFIERCIHYDKIIIDSWSTPRPFLNLKYKFKVHITGFGPIEHSHLKKLITNLNLTFSDELTNDCNFLIANLSLLGLTTINSPQLYKYKFKDILTSRSKISIKPDLTKRKINSAKKWDIPVVSISFIWELSEIGVLPDVLDSKWCIFGPQSVKTATNFLEYARSVSSGTFQTQKNKEMEIIGEDNDISQHNSPTKILSFSNYAASPIKKKSRQVDSLQLDGNRLNLKEWQKREREENVSGNNEEEEEENSNWWMEPDSDLMPIFKRRR